jgi:hypothetical protein
MGLVFPASGLGRKSHGVSAPRWQWRLYVGKLDRPRRNADSPATRFAGDFARPFGARRKPGRTRGLGHSHSERGFEVTTSPLNDQAWMKTTTPYWEGPITFEGSVKG